MKHFAVIGDPIAHSLSPVLHREIYRQINLEAKFEKIHLMPNALHSFMSENELNGFNVTIPHKQSVIPFLDELDESAKSIGAVNCVYRGKGFPIENCTKILFGLDLLRIPPGDILAWFY